MLTTACGIGPSLTRPFEVFLEPLLETCAIPAPVAVRVEGGLFSRSKARVARRRRLQRVVAVARSVQWRVPVAAIFGSGSAVVPIPVAARCVISANTSVFSTATGATTGAFSATTGAFSALGSHLGEKREPAGLGDSILWILVIYRDRALLKS